MSSTTEHIYAGRKTLIVTMAEIKSLLSMQECIELQKLVFVAHAKGDAINAPNTWLKLEKQNKWMKLLAGYVADVNGLGMKVLARFPNNPPGMNVGSIVALFDLENGFPLAIMDSIYITAIRTAAGGGLSASYCARKDAAKIGILGSGVQARFNLIAIKMLMPQIERATVFSRSEDRRRTFARRMGEEAGIQVTAVDSVQEAVSGVDIILTATNSPQPVLTRELVAPGVHIAAMGIKTEIDLAVFKGARVIGDGKQVAMEDGKFSVALEAGLVSESDLHGELGEVILGKVAGRLTDEEITIFDSSGLAVQDVICAKHVYDKARELGKGTWVDLGLGEVP